MYSKILRSGLGFLLTVATTASAWGADQPIFSARFRTQKSSLTLVILRSKKAEIRNGKLLEATCSISRLERLDNKSNVIDMKCRSARLGALVSPVSVFFSPAESINRTPAIEHPAFVRFGSWLQGYQQAILTVDMDRSAMLLKPRVQLAQR
jgi:hypothetical protein